MPEVLDYLSTKSIWPKRVIGNEAQFSCFFCDEAPNKRGRLYVNLEDGDPGGVYFCHVCGSKGNLISLKRHYGDPITPVEDLSHRRYEVMQAAAKHYHQRLADHPKHLEYLKARGLTIDTIQSRLLGFCDGTFAESSGYSQEELRAANLLATGDWRERLLGHITIPYMANGSVVQLRGKDPAGKYITLPGDKIRLYNVDDCWSADRSIILCEGEFDTMMAAQAGFKAVGFAGAVNWQEAWNGYFDEIRRVYVLFDNDDAGRKGAAKVSEAIGIKVRVLDIGPADPANPSDNDKNDLTDWFVSGHTGDDLGAMIQASSSRILMTVDDAFTEWTEMQGQAPMSFGFRMLDENLKGGMRPGQIAIPLARTGVGKTLFLLNVFQRVLMAEPDRKILFVSLEQTKFEWLERARVIYEFFYPGSNIKDMLDFFRPRLLICEENRLNEEQLLVCLDDFRDQMGDTPDLVAIDYLGYWTHSFKGEPYQRVSTGIMTLKAIAKDQRISVITPHQVGRASAEPGKAFGAEAARDSGVVEETADFVFPMWSVSNRTHADPRFRTEEIHLKVAKSRHGGKDKEFTFLYAPISQALVEENEVFAERAKANAYYNDLSMTYDQVMEEHQNGNQRWKQDK